MRAHGETLLLQVGVVHVHLGGRVKQRTELGEGTRLEPGQGEWRGSPNNTPPLV